MIKKIVYPGKADELDIQVNQHKYKIQDEGFCIDSVKTEYCERLDCYLITIEYSKPDITEVSAYISFDRFTKIKIVFSSVEEYENNIGYFRHMEPGIGIFMYIYIPSYDFDYRPINEKHACDLFLADTGDITIDSFGYREWDVVPEDEFWAAFNKQLPKEILKKIILMQQEGR